MSNPPGPDEEPTDSDGTETELIASAQSTTADDAPPPTPERRFTAPSAFDAGKTQVINTVPEPATEVFAPLGGGADAATPTERFASPGTVVPQHIPGSGGSGKQPGARRRSWGWVIAVVLVILAIVAVAIFGTVILTRNAATPQSQRSQGVAAATPCLASADYLDVESPNSGGFARQR